MPDGGRAAGAAAGPAGARPRAAGEVGASGSEPSTTPLAVEPPPAPHAVEPPTRHAVEIELVLGDGEPALSAAQCERAARAALAAAGVVDGHLAIAFVGAEHMRALNAAHRGVDRPTDVLSFPVDGAGPAAGPRELGDVVVCPAYAADLFEAVVHGVLHLCGHDHERDRGEMVELQAQVVKGLGG